MSTRQDISIIKDRNGQPLVLIHNKKFRGSTREDWKTIEKHLMSYIGNCYEITASSEKIYINKDFPDEYANYQSRIALKGARKKAKAEAVQAIPEIIKIATPNLPFWQANQEDKHCEDAQNGWYRYITRFGLPVYNDKTAQVDHYNIYSAIMLVRHAADGNKYLYDFTSIKKETSSPLEL